MCYFHVDKNCAVHYSKFSDKNLAAELKYDLSVIQLSQTRAEFDEANNMFYVKWLSLGDEKINKFIDYYHKTWVASKQSNWFVGAGPLHHNNGLEGQNQDIKANKVVRNKQKLGAFLQNAISIVHKFSIKPDERLFCPKEELVSLKMKTNGFQWMMTHQNPKDIIKIRGSYFVLSLKAKSSDDLVLLVKKFLDLKENVNFDSFDDWKHFKTTVYELKEDDGFFKCSCGDGLKKFFCKHNIALSIKFNSYQIPDTAKSVPLSENRRRGRPKKNLGWWSHV